MSAGSTRSLEELTASLAEIERSPSDRGVLRLIVRRPRPGAREVLDEAQLDPAVGLVGDFGAHDVADAVKIARRTRISRSTS